MSPKQMQSQQAQEKVPNTAGQQGKQVRATAKNHSHPRGRLRSRKRKIEKLLRVGIGTSGAAGGNVNGPGVAENSWQFVKRFSIDLLYITQQFHIYPK